eukprot:gene15376-6610_t
MESKNFSITEYVPAKKAPKKEESCEIDSMLWIWGEDSDRMTEIEAINKQLLAEYPNEHKELKNEELVDIKAQLQEAVEQEKQVLINRLNDSFERQFEDNKRKIELDLEQIMEDEIKKSINREMKYAERRKDFECKKAYAKIKCEIIKAKLEGSKICLQCGNLEASFACECLNAFYCRKACYEKHKWIHKTYCGKFKQK